MALRLRPDFPLVQLLLGGLLESLSRSADAIALYKKVDPKSPVSWSARLRQASNLDEMAAIGGVGAKKLESYGKAFLEVIAGAVEDVHPMRRKLAGRDEGAVYDRLLAVQADLQRGPDGADKPMSCSASMLAKVAQLRNADQAGLTRLIGDKYVDRFGDAFLDILREG